MMINEHDDPSCLSFSENIDESPGKKEEQSYEDLDLGANGDDSNKYNSSHFKIYEFNYNENNVKSVISSTDRKRPAT